MDERRDESLDRRIERLEQTVENLRQSVANIQQQLTPQPERPQPAPKIEPTRPTPAPPPPPPEAAQTPTPPTAVPTPQPTRPTYYPPPRPSKPSFTIPQHMRKFEYWLNKVGIALMLFAVVFLFKYSIDQGWLTPPVRVAFGLALGVVLIVIGLRLSNKKRHFALVLLGGGIATFYITGFAAFQILELVSHPTALAFMVGVTVLAFILSLTQDDAILSILGALGGLGTPFLLYTGEGNLPGLVTYTCLVLAGTIGIYFFKGWRVILWLSVVGGWIVLWIGLVNGVPHYGEMTVEHWALQWGVVFAWLAFWAAPVLREVLTSSHPDRWRKSVFGIADQKLIGVATSAMDGHVHILSISTPLIALFTSLATWPQVNETLWGWITLGAALIYAGVSYGLRRWQPLRNLAYTHGAMAVVLFTLALCFFFEEAVLQLALTAEALVLFLVWSHVEYQTGSCRPEDTSSSPSWRSGCRYDC